MKIQKSSTSVPSVKAGKRATIKKALVTVTEKQCSRCKVIKLASEFYRKASDSTGLGSHCTECRKASERAFRATPEGKAKNYLKQKFWRENNPEKAKAIAQKASKKYYEKNKELVLQRNNDRRNREKLNLFRKLKTAQPNQELILKARLS